MSVDSWDPIQYQRFKKERAQPFYDLLALLKRPAIAARVVDLGCGTGELTYELHRHLGARETLGIDSSGSMLARSDTTVPGLRFARADISSDWGGAWDVIFSNAALHWIDDHPRLFALLAQRLSAEGQLAVQMPANFDHPSHRIARELAAEEPFRTAMNGYTRSISVGSPESYAVLLHRLGFREQTVRLQVYGHVLSESAEVVEWTKGTLLTDYQRRLGADLYQRFVDDYRSRLLAELGDQRPYFYPFKRLLLWARR